MHLRGWQPGQRSPPPTGPCSGRRKTKRRGEPTHERKAQLVRRLRKRYMPFCAASPSTEPRRYGKADGDKHGTIALLPKDYKRKRNSIMKIEMCVYFLNNLRSLVNVCCLIHSSFFKLVLSVLLVSSVLPLVVFFSLFCLSAL